MKRFLPCLFIAFLAISFTACDQVAFADLGTDFSVAELPQDIVFQYTTQDLATERVSGWMISGAGEVLKYDIVSDKYFGDKPTLTENEVERIKQVAIPTEMKVDYLEMVEHYMNLPQLETTQMSEMVLNAEENVIHSVVAYRKVSTNERVDSDADVGHGCGGGSTLRTIITYDRVILQQFGLYNRENENEVAQAMLSWFWGIEANF